MQINFQQLLNKKRTNLRQKIMKIYQSENYVICEDLDHFEPKAVFTCGQAFRWYEEDDGSYTTL